MGDERRLLAERQRALALALVGQERPPRGFDERRVGVAADALRNKKRRERLRARKLHRGGARSPLERAVRWLRAKLRTQEDR